MEKLQKIWSWYRHPKWDNKQEFLLFVIEARILLPVVAVTWITLLVLALTGVIPGGSNAIRTINSSVSGFNIIVTLGNIVLAIYNISRI